MDTAADNELRFQLRATREQIAKLQETLEAAARAAADRELVRGGLAVCIGDAQYLAKRIANLCKFSGVRG